LAHVAIEKRIAMSMRCRDECNTSQRVGARGICHCGSRRGSYPAKTILHGPANQLQA
jgi:hypothetical protein